MSADNQAQQKAEEEHVVDGGGGGGGGDGAGSKADERMATPNRPSLDASEFYNARTRKRLQ